MQRSLDDLEANAVKFWPNSIAVQSQKISVIPRLIESQEKFIGILYVADSLPDAWMSVLKATSDMPGNLFLKHLMILTDVGGELLQRIRRNIEDFFPKHAMNFIWRGEEYFYQLQSLGQEGKKWTNTGLAVGGKELKEARRMTFEMQDVAMILLHGGTAINSGISENIFQKCCIGSMLGNKQQLDTFVRQRYIQVSRITGGATSNTMGQLAQSYVREHLKSRLHGWDFSRTTIPDISHNAGRTNMSFDIVAESPSGRYCAIEVSFQVTTNSVIERKAGQAQARQTLLNDHGHSIAYVIDGAGNFQRNSALKTICRYGDCVVTFSEKELDSLVDYLREFGARN